MSGQSGTERSVLWTAVLHGSLSLGSFLLAGAATVGAVHMFGDARDAAPSVEFALFERHEGPKPVLKTRLDPSTEADARSVAAASSVSEPTLDVADPGAVVAPAAPQAQSAVKITHLDDTVIRAPARSADKDARDNSRYALPKAPIAGVYENAAAGRLPRIADDGRTPAQVYARPHAANGKPKVSLIIGGLGLNRTVTQAAIDELPPGVTLSFVPYASRLQTWIDKARAAGHEVMLELPMEPYDYPNNDTGPHTLLTAASAEENARRLNVLLAQATGYFGVTNYQGAKFATDRRVVEPLIESLEERGLALIHDGAAPRSVFPSTASDSTIQFTVADRVVDSRPAADAIDQQLLHLEAIALQEGHAVGAGFAYPVTVDQFRLWTDGLDYKGFELVPASMAAGVTTPAALAQSGAAGGNS